MSLPIIRYALDPTGVDYNNLVVDEVHTLNVAQKRAIAPTYGPIFGDSVVAYDHVSNRLLVRGTDFELVELLQEATVKYGKGIFDLILILNPAVSSEVRITYQVLGGLHMNNASGVINMYETFLLDDRPVDWMNVLNKPFQYPPPLHRHLLQDIYGFEPLVVAIDRVRSAITLTNLPAFEALVDWVKGYVGEKFRVVTEQEIDIASPVNGVMTFERLLYALDKLNFNGITITPTITSVNKGTTVRFTLSTTNLPDNTVLYWTLEHIDTNDADFNTLSGVVNIVGNRGAFNVSIKTWDQVPVIAEKFKVILRKNSIVGYIMAKTSNITINAANSSNGGGGGTGGGGTTPVTDNVWMDYLTACCLHNPNIDINSYSLYLIGDRL
jgi:hypothetical protein